MGNTGLVLMAPEEILSCFNNSDEETSNLIIWSLDILPPPGQEVLLPFPVYRHNRGTKLTKFLIFPNQLFLTACNCGPLNHRKG